MMGFLEGDRQFENLKESVSESGMEEGRQTTERFGRVSCAWAGKVGKRGLKFNEGRFCSVKFNGVSSRRYASGSFILNH